jgi:hypothetical protein
MGTPSVEIRPVPPDDKMNPGDSAALRKWILRGNPSSGTLVLTEDRPLLITPVRRVTVPLPSTGRPDAVRTVCLASYHWQKNLPPSYDARLRAGITWRLLFLDGDGRVLGAGRRRDEPKASQMWPAQLFAPLESLGITVTQERYADPAAFKQAHPSV